jgi:hypothetical protein
MYPYERSLVKRLEGQPFVVIGVNSDEDRAELHKVLARKQLTWRSFWDGGSTDGPIANTWNVHSWPTIYVLDGQGVISYKVIEQVDADELDRAVDALLKGQAAAAPKAAGK